MATPSILYKATSRTDSSIGFRHRIPGPDSGIRSRKPVPESGPGFRARIPDSAIRTRIPEPESGTGFRARIPEPDAGIGSRNPGRRILKLQLNRLYLSPESGSLLPLFRYSPLPHNASYQ